MKLRFSAAVLAVVVPVVLLALLAASGLLHGANASLYRLIGSAAPQSWYAIESDVAVLRVDRSAWEAGELDWGQLRERLSEARRVVVLSPYVSGLPRMAGSGGWIVSAPGWAHSDASGINESSDRAYFALKRALGLVQNESVSERAPAPSFDFLWDSVVKLNAEGVLESEAASRLLAGKVVFIAAAPLGPGEADVARHHAVRLLAESSGMTESRLPAFMDAVFVVALTLVFTLVYQRSPISVRGVLLAGTAVVVFLAGALLFILFHVRIPAIEVLLGVAAMPGVLLAVNHGHLREAVSDSVDRQRSALEHHVVGTTTLESDAFWVQMARMVRQTLNLERLAILELPRSQHHLQEIIALRSEANALAELRRDVNRTPFLQASDENRPIRPERRFFARSAEDEIEYLVPLSFAGELVGFAAVGIRPPELNDERDFERHLMQFADAIAEMQQVRRARQNPSGPGVSWFKRLFAPDRATQLAQLHESVEELLIRRLSLVEDAINSMHTPAILFDIFGNVLVVNRAMREFSSARFIDVFGTSVTQLLQELCGSDASEATFLVRSALLTQRQSALPLRSRLQKNYSKTLHLRPVAVSEETVGFRASMLDVHGLLIEIKFSELSDDVVIQVGQRLLGRVSEDLDAAIKAARSMDDSDLDGPGREAVITELRQTLDRLEASRAALGEARGLKDKAANGLPVPVDAGEMLERVSGLADPLAGSTGVELEIEVDQGLPMVLAEAEKLRTLLALMLEYLIEDCAGGKAVSMRAESDGERVVVSLAAQGFGMPAETLQGIIDASVPASSNRFRQMQEEARHLAEWNARVSASSQVGKGTAFSIELQPYRGT